MSMELNESQKYYVPRYLDEPLRFILWTWDELNIFLLPLLLIYELTNQLLMGLFVGLLLFVGLKKLKGDQEPYFLRSLAYWYWPTLVLLKKTPASFIREYIG